MYSLFPCVFTKKKVQISVHRTDREQRITLSIKKKKCNDSLVITVLFYFHTGTIKDLLAYLFIGFTVECLCLNRN